MAVEAPVQRGPVIRIPEKRRGLSTRSKIVGAGILAGAVGLSAFGAYRASQNNNEPGSTPLPGGIVEPSNSPIPTPFSTENPTITLPPSPSPTPEITPTPTPEATPVPNIEKVEVTTIGIMSPFPSREKFPYYYMHIYDATVIAVEPIKDNSLLFAVNLGGNKISRQCNTIKNFGTANEGQIRLKLCSYKGPTLWIHVKEKTNLVTQHYDSYTRIGTGPELLLEYLEVGKTLPDISLSFSTNINASQEEVLMNRKSLSRLDTSVGESFPRTDKRFSFSTGGIIVTSE